MRGLAAVGLGKWLDVFRPLPSGQECGAPDGAFLKVYELEFSGAAFKRRRYRVRQQ
jgi:hypothetical protein